MCGYGLCVNAVRAGWPHPRSDGVGNYADAASRADGGGMARRGHDRASLAAAFPDYGDMADAKSLLESITRSFGYHYGVANKVRVNTISQSPTITTAGSGVKGFDEFIAYSQSMSPLGNADAVSCADYCITMFSDLTRYVTMQNLFHDGGFSNTGVSMEVISKFAPEEK